MVAPPTTFTIAKQRALRVLLVDDDADIVEAIGNGLRRKGYEVDAYVNPATLLAAFVPRSYDVAVIDVRMFPMDGMKLHRRLKGLEPTLVFYFLTAYADVIEGRPAGVQFLQKPISLSELVSALEAARPVG